MRDKILSHAHSSITWDSLAPRGTAAWGDPLWPDGGDGERS